MKSLGWQQNHHQKILGVWSFVSEGLSPPKPPRGNGTVWQNFSLLLMQSTRKTTWVTPYVKLARNVKLSVYKHDDRVQSGTTHSDSVILLQEAKPVLGLFCLHSNTIGWSDHLTCTIHRYAKTIGWVCLGFRIRAYGQGLGSSFRFRFRGSGFRV